MSDHQDPAVQAAWAYEELHVDALFRQWAGPVLDAAGVTAGHRVLDVACGTGILAREALKRVEPDGSVTGLDIGPGMLAVAADIQPGVRWIEGNAVDLPFDDADFEIVLCQFGLMFFPDRVNAIREMLRCAAPGGRIAVAVWDTLERSAAYPLSVDLLERRAGTAAADALRAPFVLGNIDQLRNLMAEAGATTVSIDTHVGTATFPSVRTMVEADLRGWLPIMGVLLEDDLIESILDEADEVLHEYVDAGGQMVFDAPAHILTAQPARGH